jgi:hypothetical protein
MTELEELIRREHQAPVIGTLAYILFGPIMWALQLGIVYGGHTVICTSGAPAGFAQIIVLAITAFAALTLLAFLLGQRHAARFFGLLEETAGRRTYDSLSRIIGILSMIAIIWAGGTALLVTACVQGR